MVDPFAFIPESCVDAARSGRQTLLVLLERARAADRATLIPLADDIRRRMVRGNRLAGGHLRSCTIDIVTALDAVYDEAFPISDPADVAALLDTPWASSSRRALLDTTLERQGGPQFRLDDVARQALAAGDFRLLRTLIHTPVAPIPRHLTAQALDTLHAAGELDAATIERAFAEDRYLWGDIAGLACAGAVRDRVDARVWRLVTTVETPGAQALPVLPGPSPTPQPPDAPSTLPLTTASQPPSLPDPSTLPLTTATRPPSLSTALSPPGRLVTSTPSPDLPDIPGLPDEVDLPKAPAPRGLRFVRVALDWAGDRAVADHLGTAELTVGEQHELVALLRERPEADVQRVWQWRITAGDDDALLPLFDLEAGGPLLRLTSGSIHVEPAGYLCIVPAGFGATAHRRLFLPFADDDRMTSVILSKVLLLSEDDRITDPSILQQLKALT
jgi:hypothetical protein